MSNQSPGMRLLESWRRKPCLQKTWFYTRYDTLTAMMILATLSNSCESLWSRSLKTVLRTVPLLLLPPAPPVLPSRSRCSRVDHSTSHTWQRWVTWSDEVVSSSERRGATSASQKATASVFFKSGFEELLKSVSMSGKTALLLRVPVLSATDCLVVLRSSPAETTLFFPPESTL